MIAATRAPAREPGTGHPKYRPDIDGLRAVAVLSVVGYHAAPGWIRGGFIGVDIFFVISGYLISSIIFGGLDAGEFSFAEFYARRVRRIFPALILVLSTSFAFGWFWLFDDEYKQLGEHIAAGAGFVSNFILLGERGYFDNAAETKPLLHLWSLGVEEQFYIVWPSMAWLAWRARLNPLIVVPLIAAASFALNVAQAADQPVVAFYSPLSRFWELLTGAMLAVWTLRKASLPWGLCPSPNARAIFGAGLVAAGLAVIDTSRNFPGWWALFPAMGAALLISAGPAAWFNRAVLSTPALVWVGLISYPLYLWHWPLLSFARIIEGGTPPAPVRLELVGLALALAWLTYRLVEKPIRYPRRGGEKAIALAALAGIVGLVGYNCYARDGLAFRGPSATALKSGRDGGDIGHAAFGCGLEGADSRLLATCVHDDRGAAVLALLGDSKADALYRGLMRTSNENDRWIFMGGTNDNGSPDPLISNEAVYANYQRLARIALRGLSSNKDVKVVAIASATRIIFSMANLPSISGLPDSPNYDIALAALSNGVGELVKAGKKVVLVEDNPTLADPKECVARTKGAGLTPDDIANSTNKCDLSLADHLRWSAPYRRLLLAVAAQYPGSVSIFDTTPILCDEARGVCPMFKNGRILYSVTDHISDYAAGLVGQKLNALILGTIVVEKR